MSGSKAIFLTEHGGMDGLKIRQNTMPTPGKNEVVVNIRATGVNFAELMARQGSYDRIEKLPWVMGCEGGGVITQIGSDVTNFKVGDRVMCIGRSGLWKEYLAMDRNQCFPMPEGMSFEEAAAIPVNYITAFQMLFKLAHLTEGKKVLIHMAAGGVGMAAIQLCKTVPNVTVFGTCSASKHAAVRANGLDHPIDYRTKDYVDEVRRISPEGVDIVLDPLNGADAEKGYELLKPFGTIVHYGAANIVTGTKKSLFQMIRVYWNTKKVNPLFIMKDNKCRAGYHLGWLVDHFELLAGTAVELLELYKSGKIKPTIDSVWAFEDIGKAMERMHERKNVGKVLLSPQKEKGKRDIRGKE